MAYNVLVIGSGGREHALAWKISQSENLDRLYCLPGNPGTAAIAENLPYKVGDFQNIVESVRKYAIDLVVVGPEAPLVDGIQDILHKEFPELLIVGPSAQGAMLEGSKDFAKAFMSRHGIPTASYKSFTQETLNEAYSFLDSLQPPYVLKADGLAAGKGVIIDNSLENAKKELSDIFSGKFSDAGKKVVIEEFLSGIEVSIFVLTDGKDYLILPEAKDYKRVMDGDRGLNTGGMGSVSPVPFVDDEFKGKVESRIVKPTIEGLKKEGIDYKGFIFLGLMNCNGDPYVIEYNARMGDPETESVMMRIESDFLQHLVATASGQLASENIQVSKEAAVTVVMTSGGYPEHYKSYYPIYGLGDVRDGVVFHAGTMQSPDGIVTSGGRVLAVTAKGAGVVKACDAAYAAVDKIYFKDCFYRHDIAKDIIALI
ncbi:MAG: phosphoribosylamine--glycine ligase [Bacteroidales bacterium]|nr:phosphoribosylamine--glycine ligase [Bacteroidales bacterium]